jgi:hypothetical protein
MVCAILVPEYNLDTIDVSGTHTVKILDYSGKTRRAQGHTRNCSIGWRPRFVMRQEAVVQHGTLLQIVEKLVKIPKCMDSLLQNSFLYSQLRTLWCTSGFSNSMMRHGLRTKCLSSTNTRPSTDQISRQSFKPSTDRRWANAGPSSGCSDQTTTPNLAAECLSGSTESPKESIACCCRNSAPTCSHELDICSPINGNACRSLHVASIAPSSSATTAPSTLSTANDRCEICVSSKLH